MTDAKHTPGPWNIPPASKYTTIYAGRNTHVAAVKRDGLTDAEIEGNADLIAAAPELFQLLEAACASVEEQSVWDKPPYSEWYYKAKAIVSREVG